MGVSAVVARARAEGAKVVFVDPRMPEGALTGAEWVAIRPGTDSAFLLSLIHVGLKEGLVDTGFLAHHTNAPYLVEEGTLRPLAASELIQGAPADAWVVTDTAKAAFAPMGVVKDEKGTVKGFAEPEGVMPDVNWKGTVTTTEGKTLNAETVLTAFKRVSDKWTPAEAAKVTGIPAAVITRIAREFFTRGGVADDGWYASRNGNDTRDFALLSIMNVFAGNLDKEGGFVVTQGGGFKAPGVSFSGGKGKAPPDKPGPGPRKRRLIRCFIPKAPEPTPLFLKRLKQANPIPSARPLSRHHDVSP